MVSLGLLLGREHVRAALQRRMVLVAIVLAVVVPVPVFAVLFVTLLGVKGAVAAGIVLMSISPGAPVALRRTLTAGGRAEFAPALHLTIVLLAVVSVPASLVILSMVFDAAFTVSPLQVAGQVFQAQLLPMGLGIAFRAGWPAGAAWLAPRLTTVSNGLLMVLLVVCLYVFWPALVAAGWTPVIAGVLLTAGALAVGAASAGRDAAARPQAALAAAMRNPGLALFIAAVNQAPAGVAAAVLGYALGATVVVTAWLAWRGSSRPRPVVYQ